MSLCFYNGWRPTDNTPSSAPTMTYFIGPYMSHKVEWVDKELYSTSLCYYRVLRNTFYDLTNV